MGTLWLGFDDFDPIFKVTAGLWLFKIILRGLRFSLKTFFEFHLQSCFLKIMSFRVRAGRIGKSYTT